MGSDTQFIADGPAPIGFRVGGARINVGGKLTGTDFGVSAACGDGQGIFGAAVEATSEVRRGNAVIATANVGADAFALWGKSREGFAGVFDGNVKIRSGGLTIENGGLSVPSVSVGEIVTNLVSVNGSVHINGSLTVEGGAKSAAIRDRDGHLRRLYAMESPESWFEDVGFGELVDSYAEVDLDDTFAYVTADDPYHVFLSAYDQAACLYVADRSSTGFAVRASTAGVSCQFSYRVLAKRNDGSFSRFSPVDEGARAAVFEEAGSPTEDTKTPEKLDAARAAMAAMPEG